MVLLYNPVCHSLMWCRAVWGRTGKSGNRLQSIPKRLLRSCDLYTLVTVCAGDEPDNKIPGKCGNRQLRHVTNDIKALMSKSMSLVFKDRSLEIMLSSDKEMHEFVNGFRCIIKCTACVGTV